MMPAHTTTKSESLAVAFSVLPACVCAFALLVPADGALRLARAALGGLAAPAALDIELELTDAQARAAAFACVAVIAAWRGAVDYRRSQGEAPAAVQDRRRRAMAHCRRFLLIVVVPGTISSYLDGSAVEARFSAPRVCFLLCRLAALGSVFGLRKHFGMLLCSMWGLSSAIGYFAMFQSQACFGDAARTQRTAARHTWSQRKALVLHSCGLESHCRPVLRDP